MTHVLEPADLQAFDDEGVLLLKAFFASTDTDEWLAAYPALKSSINQGASNVHRSDRFIWGFMPAPIGAIFRHPKLVALSTQRLGPDVALYMNRLLLKDEAWSGSVGTHQDAPYFNGGHDKLSVFVPLTYQSPATGGLIFHAGSHKYGNLGFANDILSSEFPVMPLVEPELEVGDILLSNFFTWHYSNAPVQPRERALLQIVYQPASDGSYEGGTMKEPTLVAGSWRTRIFVPNKFGVATAPPPPTQTAASDVVATGNIPPALAILQKRGCARVGLLASEAGLDAALATVETTPALAPVVVVKGSGPRVGSRVGRADVLSIEAATASSAFDGLLIADAPGMPELMRAAQPLFLKGTVIAPAHPSQVVPEWMLTAGAYDVVWKWAAVEYAARSGLKGHYLEFGTFWGRSFFLAYHHLREWIKGDFYAFDSFAGLSKPLQQETDYTVGDFLAGAYACNQESFRAIAQLVGVDEKRLKVVEGFYSDTLGPRAAAAHGLAPGSVSICVIDCDLFAPSLEALEFVRPLLEPGALIYFDDWRLTRASPKVGERAAALEWLRRYPDIELVELHRDHWQHQWFIYHPDGGQGASRLADGVKRGARWFRRRSK